MHNTLHIGRFEARHHVADEDGQRLARAAQQQLLDGELEAALMHLTGDDEVVLLKHLQTRLRLSGMHTDRDNARRWSDAIAASLSHALQHAGPQDLLRFGSRAQALHTFVADVLQARSTRDWAWQRLSLLPANSSRSNSPAQRQAALLRLLADTPDDGVPLLRGLLHSTLWPRLIDTLDDGELRGLAQSVLTRLAGPQAVGFGADWRPDAKALRATPDTALAAIADATLPPWFTATVRAARTGPRRCWALRLSCMLVSPALARRGPSAVDTQLQTWAAAASDDTSLQGLDTQPARDLQDQPTGATASARQNTELSSSVQEEIAATARTTTPTTTGHTEHGGLLLLAPLLPTSGALALLEDSTVWPAGTLPQALQHLALRLGSLAPEDPAALAFCGLVPTAAAPKPLMLSTRQDAALEIARERLLQHLTERLATRRDSESPRSADASAALAPSQALARVVPRRARIQFDPGWIDVFFLLRDVSTDLRRAALDLDPGFLPWLGLVLRFRYE